MARATLHFVFYFFIFPIYCKCISSLRHLTVFKGREREVFMGPFTVLPTGSTPPLLPSGSFSASKAILTGAINSALSSRPSADSSAEVSSGSDAGSAVEAVPAGSGTYYPVSSYLNADLAKVYGMDNATAYQEAMSNTSYQRAVRDLKAAGLNPALLMGSASGASGVGYIGSGGVSSGVSSGASAHNYYKALSNVGGIAGGLGTLLVTKNPATALKGAAIGSSIMGSIGNLIDQVQA